MKLLLLLAMTFSSAMLVTAQNVGIGTTTPHADALLHLDLGASPTKGLLVTGTYHLFSSTVPDLGAGSRLMFYPGKAAFRAGYVGGTQWNNSNVGRFSTALGGSTTASGDYSTAMGEGTTASSYASIAMGYNGVASGNYSAALGASTTASGNYATALGGGTTASGNYSMAEGFVTNASGSYSTALGYETSASGVASTALGSATTASGLASTAMGWVTTAKGSISTALGNRTIAKGAASTVVGTYNDSILTYDETFISAATPLFIVGNGDITARSNALVVRKDGKVAVGNITPEYTLDVANRVRLRSGGDVNNTAGIWFNNVDNSAVTGFMGMYNDNSIGFYGATGAGWGLLMNTTNGNIGIGTTSPSQKLHVVGNICYTGSSAACSDIRYKTNLLPLSNALDAVIKLHPIYYHWKKEYKDKGFGGERQIGFSAQEVETLFPELVQTGTDGYKAVDYSRLTPVLVQAIKEQQEQIRELQAEARVRGAEIQELQAKDREQQKQLIKLQERLERLEKITANQQP